MLSTWSNCQRNSPSSCRWYKTPRGSSDVTVMKWWPPHHSHLPLCWLPIVLQYLQLDKKEAHCYTWMLKSHHIWLITTNKPSLASGTPKIMSNFSVFFFFFFFSETYMCAVFFTYNFFTLGWHRNLTTFLMADNRTRASAANVSTYIIIWFRYQKGWIHCEYKTYSAHVTRVWQTLFNI